MADVNDPNPKVWYALAALAGSLLTLRALVEASAWVRVSSVLSSLVFGYYIGPPFARRIINLPADDVDAIAGVTLIVAFVGANLLAAVGEFMRRAARDPAAAISWVLSLVRGGPTVPPPAPVPPAGAPENRP